jgi:hypothetical protein
LGFEESSEGIRGSKPFLGGGRAFPQTYIPIELCIEKSNLQIIDGVEKIPASDYASMPRMGRIS